MLNIRDLLLHTIGKKALDSLLILRRNFVHLVEHPAGALRLAPAQVRLAALGAQDLACAGDLEAALGLLVRFHLRHRTSSLPSSPTRSDGADGRRRLSLALLYS